MNLFYFYLGCVLLILNSFNTALGQYAFSVGSSGFEFGTDLAFDNQGNIFLIGTFDETIDFDPSSNLLELSPIVQGGSRDIFIVSYNPSGNIRFVFALGSQQGGVDSPGSISVDNEGNIFITGQYAGIVDFDPSDSVTELVSDNAIFGNKFIASYTNNGEFRFAFSFNSNLLILPGEMDVKHDHLGNIYLSGIYNGTIDFNPGPDINELSVSTLQLSTFLASYDKNGNFRFVYDLGLIGGVQPVHFDIDVGFDGNVYILGRFSGTTDFDPGPEVFELSGSVLNNLFIASFDSDGDFLNAFNIDADFGLMGAGFFDLSVSPNGNINITGSIFGTVDFDPSGDAFELSTTSWNDMFLASYNNLGNFRYAFLIGNEETAFDAIETASPTEMVVDNLGNIYITGLFQGIIDFDPSENVFELVNDFSGINLDNVDIFVCSYDNQGKFRFASKIGSEEKSDDGSLYPSISVNNNDYSHCITGGINGSLVFDPDENIYEVIDDFTNSNVLLACYTSNGELVTNIESEVLYNHEIYIYPNPVDEFLTLETPEKLIGSKLVITDILGRVVSHGVIENSMVINVSNFQKGFYNVTIFGYQGRIVKSVIVR